MSKKPVVKAGLPVGKPTTGMSVKNKTAGSEAPAAVVTPANNAALAEDRMYRAKSALEDIERAEHHRSNKELMKDVKKHARDKIKTLKGIC